MPPPTEGAALGGSPVGLSATSDAAAAPSPSTQASSLGTSIPQTPMQVDICPICLSSSSEDDDPWWTLSCGHGFHTKCIVDCLRFSGHGRCPMCRDTPQQPSPQQPTAQQPSPQQPPLSIPGAPPESKQADPASKHRPQQQQRAMPPSAPPIAPQPTQVCKGVFARCLIDNLRLHEKPPSDEFAYSSELVTVLHCKSCRLGCGCKPHRPCPLRRCPKDGVEIHQHRGFFKPLPPIPCLGVASGLNEQCSRCQWLESSADKRGLWAKLKLSGSARVSPLQQQAKAAEVAWQNGTLGSAPAPQKRKDLLTRTDALALLACEKEARQQAEKQSALRVAELAKRARFAERHQSTAEGVVQLASAERDRACLEAQQAKAAATEQTVARASAEAEAGAARQLAERRRSELMAVQSAANAQEAAARVEAQALGARLEAQEAESAAAAVQLQATRADAEARAKEQRTAHRQDLAAAALRLDSAQLKVQKLTRENASLLSQLSTANATIAELQKKLDAAVDTDNPAAFVESLDELYRNDQIEQKDLTLLEHLTKRLRYRRGGKCGAIDGVMRDLQDLLVDKLCRQDYTLVADVLHLSCFEQAAVGRSRGQLSYFVGFNDHVLEVQPSHLAPQPASTPLQVVVCSLYALAVTGQGGRAVRRTFAGLDGRWDACNPHDREGSPSAYLSTVPHRRHVSR